MEGQRGALPMLAFAAARAVGANGNGETGLPHDREAYEQIGGVGGALAQHAETHAWRADRRRITFHIVRELFRNLVTAQGTRAARDREELLSVFAGPRRATRSRAGLMTRIAWDSGSCP